MDPNQLQVVETAVNRYYEINLAKRIAEKYENESTIENITIGDYTVKEFISTVNKVFGQFREELKTPYSKALPYQYQFQNEYGGSNLSSDLNHIVNYIEQRNFAPAVPALKRLIHYQALNGFWEKSKRKYFRVTEATLKEEQERLDLVTQHLKEVIEARDDLLLGLEEKDQALSILIKTKTKELDEIEALVGSARQQTTEIHETNNSVTSIAAKISTLMDVSNDKREDILEIYDEVKALFDELNEELSRTKSDHEKVSKKLNELINSLEEKVTFALEKSTYFEERNSYLDDLIGREVGASLFETFKHRKGELSSSIGFWKWSVPITALGVIAWIYFLFGVSDLANTPWQVILVNTLKAIPALGLLVFTISQYVKERNFQEEYAFKSAVALTVNSYAEQLKSEENKDRMVMQSVSQIYESPIYKKRVEDKERKLPSTDELLKIFKQATDKDK